MTSKYERMMYWQRPFISHMGRADLIPVTTEALHPASVTDGYFQRLDSSAVSAFYFF